MAEPQTDSPIQVSEGMPETLGPAKPALPVVVLVLIGITAVVAVLALAGAIAGLVAFNSPEAAIGATRIMLVAGPLVIGLAACGMLLVGILSIRALGRLSEQADRLQQDLSVLPEQIARLPARSAGEADTVKPEQIYALLKDIRETILLPDSQRERSFLQMKENEFRQRIANAERFVASHDFHHARQQLAFLADRYGPEERIKVALTRLEQVAREAAAKDIAAARTRIQDLMSLSRWDEAELLARELADKYPTAPDPVAIIEHVCRERQLYEYRNRQRLHDEIQQFVNQRRWQEAAQAARQFISMFPIGADTEMLRTQLETLEANAEIQNRQQLEQQIKEHIRSRQYWEALGVARRIIAEYPFSPQANALRSQLARLEDLAHSQQPRL